MENSGNAVFRRNVVVGNNSESTTREPGGTGDLKLREQHTQREKSTKRRGRVEGNSGETAGEQAIKLQAKD